MRIKVEINIKFLWQLGWKKLELLVKYYGTLNTRFHIHNIAETNVQLPKDGKINTLFAHRCVRN